MFIVIEGTDASGKHTQSTRLHEKLTSLGVRADLFSFPRYGTPVGQAILRHLKRQTLLADMSIPPSAETVAEDIRHADDPVAFQAMMLADKYDAAVEIRAAIAKGHFVVCDRWWPSAYAYGSSDGLDDKWLERIHASLPEADFSFFLDVPVSIAKVRRPEARDRYEEQVSKQEQIRERYRHLWRMRATSKAGYWISIDGTKNLDDVSRDIWSAIADVNKHNFFGFRDDTNNNIVVRRVDSSIQFSSMLPQFGGYHVQPVEDVRVWAQKLREASQTGDKVRFFICDIENEAMQLNLKPSRAEEFANRLLGLSAL